MTVNNLSVLANGSLSGVQNISKAETDENSSLLSQTVAEQAESVLGNDTVTLSTSGVNASLATQVVSSDTDEEEETAETSSTETDVTSKLLEAMDDDDDDDDDNLSSIISKVYSGATLSASELQTLQSEAPEMYSLAMKAKEGGAEVEKASVPEYM